MASIPSRAALVALSLASILVSAGCPTVELGDTPSEIGLCNPPGGVEYFEQQIWPMFVERNNAANSCARAACHISAGNGLDYPPPPVDYPTAYKRTQLYLNCGTPSASQFLTKPLAGIEPHSGGDIFTSMTDPAVQVFLGWFQ